MRTLYLVLCLLWLTGCTAKSPVAPTPLNRLFTLGPGEIEAVDGLAVVRFVGVTGDSRCPADALCILGGDAIVRIEITELRGSSGSYDLHTAQESVATHGSLSIHLVRLAPYPFSASPIDPAEYQATLRATR